MRLPSVLVLTLSFITVDARTADPPPLRIPAHVPEALRARLEDNRRSQIEDLPPPVQKLKQAALQAYLDSPQSLQALKEKLDASDFLPDVEAMLTAQDGKIPGSDRLAIQDVVTRARRKGGRLSYAEMERALEAFVGEPKPDFFPFEIRFPYAHPLSEEELVRFYKHHASVIEVAQGPSRDGNVVRAPRAHARHDDEHAALMRPRDRSLEGMTEDEALRIQLTRARSRDFPELADLDFFYLHETDGYRHLWGGPMTADTAVRERLLRVYFAGVTLTKHERTPLLSAEREREVRGFILSELGSPEPRVRLKAFGTLCGHMRPEDLEAAMRLTADPAIGERVLAALAESWGHYYERGTRSALLAGLGSPDPQVRAWASDFVSAHLKASTGELRSWVLAMGRPAEGEAIGQFLYEKLLSKKRDKGLLEKLKQTIKRSPSSPFDESQFDLLNKMKEQGGAKGKVAQFLLDQTPRRHFPESAPKPWFSLRCIPRTLERIFTGASAPRRR